MGLDVIGIGEEIPAGSIIAGFDYRVPLSDEVCESHIAGNLKRGLPEAVRRRKLTVIAGGPSARKIDLASVQGETLAVNGSLGLFIEQGLAPTYWAACDPQDIVANFLPDNPPKDTTYLIASKCHPSVFDKLKNREIVLWHLKDHDAGGRSRIALASSITLSATWLMHRLGYTDFEYWGWDGCFMDGKHHATCDADWSTKDRLHLNYGGEIKDGEVIGGEVFETTRTWAAEAQGAEQFFQLAEYFDIRVTVNGGGMFATAREVILKP